MQACLVVPGVIEDPLFNDLQRDLRLDNGQRLLIQLLPVRPFDQLQPADLFFGEEPSVVHLYRAGDEPENIRFELLLMIRARNGKNLLKDPYPVFEICQITKRDPVGHILHAIEQKLDPRMVNVSAVPVVPDQVDFSILKESIHPGHKKIDVVSFHLLVVNGTGKS